MGRVGRQANPTDDFIPLGIDPVQIPDRFATRRVPHQDIEAVFVGEETGRIAGGFQEPSPSPSASGGAKRLRERRRQVRKGLQPPALADEFLDVGIIGSETERKH